MNSIHRIWSSIQRPSSFYKDVYFCLNQILNRAEGGGVIDSELGLSRDGIDWRRPFRESFFIPRPSTGDENRMGQSEKNQFDSGSIFTNSTPVFLEDAIRFYLAVTQRIRPVQMITRISAALVC